ERAGPVQRGARCAGRGLAAGREPAREVAGVGAAQGIALRAGARGVRLRVEGEQVTARRFELATELQPAEHRDEARRVALARQRERALQRVGRERVEADRLRPGLVARSDLAREPRLFAFAGEPGAPA